MDHARRRWPAALLPLALPLAALGADAAEFRSRFETPAVSIAIEADGRAEVRAAGHETHARRPGVPDVPWRTVLVAIPPGAEPRLEVRAVGTPERIGAVIPRPVATLLAVGDGTEQPAPGALPGVSIEPAFRPDASAYSGKTTWPASLAWLGRRGVLRAQHYVELHLAPIRFDPAQGGLVREAALDVTVHFDGAARGGAWPGDDPLFEDVYRRAFVNYGQGRAFRARLPRPADPALPLAPEGSEPPRRRIVVREEGVVRFDHAFLLAHAPEFLAHDPALWRLTSRGVQVPLDVHQSGANPAALEPGEWVQFFGQALDAEPEQVLNTDTGGIEDLFEVRDFSDENVYFLTVAGGPQPAMPERLAAPGIGSPPADFPATARVENDDVFFPLAGAGIEFALPLLSESAPTLAEVVPLPNLASDTAPAEIRVSLRGVSECDGWAPDHASRVRLRNAALATLVLPPGNPANSGNANLGQFDGQTVFVHEFGWTHSGGDPIMTDPLEVEIEVDNLPQGCPTGGVVRNDVLLDWIEVDYRRSFAASGDTLVFEYPDGDADFAVTGLASDAADLHVYEVTGDVDGSGIADAVRLTGVQVTAGAGSFTARFRMDEDPAIADGALRRFVVCGAGAIAPPAPGDFRADRVSELRTDTTPADLVIVAHPDLLDSRCSIGGGPCAYDTDCTAGAADRCEIDPGSVVAQYIAHRAGQGISARVARIGDIEDEFGDGLAGPLAIRSFLEWTVGGGWGGTPPAYALLLGDASYDYKGGTATGNYVWTQLMVKKSPILAFYASDNVLADVAGADHLPDLAIGRVSARTLAEAETALGKILAYEQSPAPGAWRSNALFISDRANDFGAFEAGEFERINAIGEQTLAGTSYTSQNLRYWSDRCVPSTWTCTLGANVCTSDADCAGGGGVCRPNCDKAGMRQAILDAVNGDVGPGAAIAQYMGHGNFDLWSSDVLFCANDANPVCPQDDTASLTNGPRLPWLIVHNCLTSGFHSLAAKSFGEQWQKIGAGGAVAVFAPSGLGFRFLGEGVTDVIWDDVFGPHKQRQLAVPVMDSLVLLCSQDSIEGCQYYTLLGDPALRLALPDVDPPGDMAAVGGDGVVHLTWTASATADATYDVWRTRQLLPPYTLPYEKINAAPVLGSGYDDLDVQNTQDYFYYVVAVDPAGFESRWSNFNSDCDVVGPDCVVATPFNPTPPSAPTGLTVTDAELGGSLDLAWQANPEYDIDHYRIEFGTTPALGEVRTSHLRRFTLTGLANGTTYFVAVRATNTSGVTSAPSPTLSAVPTLVLGVRSPDFVTDLRIARAGDDALLLWSPVTLDIYGKPAEVAHYEVYRSTMMEFTPTPENRIGTATEAEFQDDGALAAPVPNYFYRVRAVDGQGNPGGFGGQLPDGIRALVLARVRIGGHIILSWPAVLVDFDGAPTEIARYEVYASPVPLGRAEIEAGSAGPPLWSGPATVVDLIQGAGTRFFTVLAVDHHGNRSPF